MPANLYSNLQSPSFVGLPKQKLKVPKVLMTLFVVILVLVLGLLGEYSYLSSQDRLLDWNLALKLASKNCKEGQFDTNNNEEISHIAFLLKSEGIVLGPPPSYNIPEEVEEFIAEPIPGTNTCWVVFVGDQQGKGTMLYEKKNGEIIKLTVENASDLSNPKE